MKKGRYLASLAVMLALVAGAVAAFVLLGGPQLGLDLRGGISAIYTPQLQSGEEQPEDFDEVLDETISVIRARVDSLGVAEPVISRQGDDVLVQLPGLDDAERAQEIIGTTAKLTFRPVEEVLQPGTPAYEEAPTCDVEERPQLGDDEPGVLCAAPETQEAQTEPLKYRVGPAALSGDAIADAVPTISGGGTSGGWSVALDLDREGGERFAEITGELACERDQGAPGGGLLAIVLDNAIESAPAMNPGVACGEGITGGSAQITVGGATTDESEAEARDLALVLKTGALPITLEPSTFETVSPTLGSESLRSGLLAGLLGLALVAVWLVLFYRILGAVAIGSLLVFGALILGLVTALGEIGFALTLAGVAGIIVSIGITADSSIIFFERIRDEVSLGKTVRTSVQRGFDSAFRTNLAGNTVTLSAAAVLYFLAVGPVRGFALTLGIATVLDILILYFFSRPVVTLLSRTRAMTRRSLGVAPEPVRPAVAKESVR